MKAADYAIAAGTAITAVVLVYAINHMFGNMLVKKNANGHLA